MLDLVGENRRLVGAQADDDAGLMKDLSILEDPDNEFGDVDVDVVVAEVARYPAPTLHIGDDLGLGID